MAKKIYAYFVINDRWHCEDSVDFCVFGTLHEIKQYQWMMLAHYAKEWDRRFDPFDEFMPYDWNGNQVYSVWINSWKEGEKRPSGKGYDFKDISALVA